MRRNGHDEYRYISCEIKKDFVDELDRAIEIEGLTSRSSLIRHLLWCWLGESKKSQELENK